ncbi:hypothetical protein ACSX1A_15545 [Pontibacter sp. MBLB2868]|uniref:hypothetical protein n=1 Tax=Pontibacter sp. MBLB2868 TaxID=3451555 RepID=UPI003F750BCC
MKHNWKLAFIACALLAFTACKNEDKPITESENIEDTEELNTELGTGMDEDTVTVQDSTINNGVMDEIEEEQPPVQ